MRKIVLIALFLIAACAWAQVEPAATGPAFPQMNGNLQYSARYSQAGFLYDQTQFPGGNQVSSTVSANLAYTHPSVRRPFSMEYSGGYMWPISGPSLGTGVFQHLLLSQSFVQRRWTLVASDGVSYTPQSPIIGFSGVPGTGEPVGGSGTTPAAGQSILTVNTRVLDNHADLRLQYSLGHATTFAITGGSELLRYPDSNGLDSDGEDADAEIAERLNARNTLGGHFNYAHYRYSASPYSNNTAGSFDTESAYFSYRRIWSRRFKMDLAAGPQWTTGSNDTVVPSTKTVMARAAANYQLRSEWFSLGYSRGINGGAGYIPGATVDTVQGDFSRTFGRDLLLTMMGAYMHTAALMNNTGITDARIGGVNASERLGSFISFFGSYTFVNQTTKFPGSTPQSNLISQPYQVISFGIGYSPREKRLRR